MHKYNLYHPILYILLIITFSCSNKKNINPTQISVSILPQEKIVERLLGDSVQINVMVTKGNSPATYSPTPQQMRLISESSLYIRIGHIGFEETWMNKLQDLNPKMKITDSSKDITLIEDKQENHSDETHSHHHHGIDPHIWTSPKTMMLVVKNTKKILEQHFPEKSHIINVNSQKLLDDLQKMDSTYTSQLANHQNRNFLIFHPAYTYLAKDYGLEQISIENEGKEPGVKWLTETISNAKSENIKAILIQEEFNQKSAEIIAKELNIPIIQVHPLAEDFISEMKELLVKLNKALN